MRMSHHRWKAFLWDKCAWRAFVWSDTPSHERSRSAVWLPSRPVIAFCLRIKKTSSELIADRWVIEELTADDRHKKKIPKANPQNYSQPLSRLLCNLFFSPTCRLAGGLSGVSGSGLLITSAAASIRLSPWLQSCRWVGWAFRSYPLSPGAFTPAMRCSISRRCTRLTPTQFCASRVRLLSLSGLLFLGQN